MILLFCVLTQDFFTCSGVFQIKKSDTVLVSDCFPVAIGERVSRASHYDHAGARELG